MQEMQTQHQDPHGFKCLREEHPHGDRGLEGATQPLFLPTSPGRATLAGMACRDGGEGRAEGRAAPGESNGLQHII